MREVPEPIEKMLFQLSLTGCQYTHFVKLNSCESVENWRIYGRHFFVDVTIINAESMTLPKQKYQAIQYQACTALDYFQNVSSEQIALFVKARLQPARQMSLELN